MLGPDHEDNSQVPLDCCPNGFSARERDATSYPFRDGFFAPRNSSCGGGAVRFSTGSTYLWLMNGPTVIGGGASALMPGEARVAGVGDFNADGREDVVWRRPSISRTAIFMNGVSIGSSALTHAIGPEWTLAAPVPY